VRDASNEEPRLGGVPAFPQTLNLRQDSLLRASSRRVKRAVQCCAAKCHLHANDLTATLCTAAMRPLAVLSAFLDVSSLNLAAPHRPPFFCLRSTGDASGPPWPPEKMRLSRFNQAFRLDDPGVRLRLIAEIRNYSRPPTPFRHLNADPPILLPYQPVCRFSHDRQCRLVVRNATNTLECPFCSLPWRLPPGPGNLDGRHRRPPMLRPRVHPRLAGVQGDPRSKGGGRAAGRLKELTQPVVASLDSPHRRRGEHVLFRSESAINACYTAGAE
jgi:hypothetical protein